MNDMYGASGAGKKNTKQVTDYTGPGFNTTAGVGLGAGAAAQGVKNATSGGGSKSGGPSADVGVSSNYGADYGGGFDYASFLNAQLAQQRAAAQAAYNRNMARISDSYGSAASNLRGNYDSTVERLNAARDKSMGDVRGDAEKSLREAYINNMLSKKNLDQRLSAMGYNGGATESTMASLSNNYGNSRLGINETLNKNIADLEQTYGDNLASALQAYNTAMNNLNMQKMSYEMQAENALNNASATDLSGIGSLLSMDQSYLKALSGALQNQGNYSYDASKATNDYVAGQVQQAQNNAASANYAKAIAQAQLLESQGGATNSQLIKLANGDPQTLAQILAALGR